MLAHACVAIVLIALLTVVSKFLEYVGDHRLFQVIPLSYVFDAMDCAILIVFGTFGVIEAIAVFKGDDHAKPVGTAGSDGAKE